MYNLAGMGSRGVQAALVIVVLVFGVAAALAVGGARKHQTATGGNSPAVTASPEVTPSPSRTPSPSPSLSPSEAPSPSAAPSEAPPPAPAPQPAPGGSGPAAYPAQIRAGTTYSYRGSAVLVAHATDSIDSGSSVCAGINESTQGFPAGDRGVFFVGVQFPDRQILAAGYIRRNGARIDFASIQDANHANRAGVLGSDPGAGSHTYCVSHSASGWAMTRDGNQLYSTTREAATGVGGALLKFDSNLEPSGTGSPAASNLVIPGFHDISIGGSQPRQLRGSIFYA